MGIDMSLAGTSLGVVRRTWDGDCAMLYAMGVGAGEGFGDRELAYTTENSANIPQQVLPGYATVLGYPAAGLLDQGGPAGQGVSGDDGASGGNGRKGAPSIFGGFPASSVLHAGHELTLHGPLPVAGTGHVLAAVTAVHDTGAHALVTVTTELRTADPGTGPGGAGTTVLLATNRAMFLVRGAGGFGGPGPEPARWHAPGRAPDDVIDFATGTTQGLLYRLSGDRNRLHSDPAAAREAGFDRPVLHGLCTYGFAARALLHTACPGGPADFGTMSARFTHPVVPGNNLTIKIWDDEDTVRFQVLTAGRVVLDHGSFTRRPNVNKGVTND